MKYLLSILILAFNFTANAQDAREVYSDLPQVITELEDNELDILLDNGKVMIISAEGDTNLYTIVGEGERYLRVRSEWLNSNFGWTEYELTWFDAREGDRKIVVVSRKAGTSNSLWQRNLFLLELNDNELIGLSPDERADMLQNTARSVSAYNNDFERAVIVSLDPNCFAEGFCYLIYDRNNPDAEPERKIVKWNGYYFVGS